MWIGQPEHILTAMHKLRAAIRDACLAHDELPSVRTSIVSCVCLLFFYARAENTIFISPRLRNGARATYVMTEDVCLTTTDVNAQLLYVHTKVRLDSESGDITITYTLDSKVEFTHCLFLISSKNKKKSCKIK